MKIFKKGFTLIELLIVIALLGILAIGLLAALDPFDQLKKGTDTGVRNTVSEVQGAVIRFYAIKGFMPWCDDSTCAAPLDAGEPTAATLFNAMPATIQAIVDTGELKVGFDTLAANQISKIYVTGSQAGGSITVCYKPESKSFQKDPSTQYWQDGTAAGANCTVGTNCYWCVK